MSIAPKIVAIVGSRRSGSLNAQLASLAGGCLDGRADFSILDYADVPFFDQDMESPAPDPVRRVRSEVSSADGLWFFTPEYNHSLPGGLKNLVDWLSRPCEDGSPQVLAGKRVAVSGITPGMSGTGLAQDHLVTVLSFLDCRIMNVPRLTVPRGLEQTVDGRLVLDQSMRYLQRQADAFLRFLERNPVSQK